MIALKLLGSFFLVNGIIGTWIPSFRTLRQASDGMATGGDLLTVLAISSVFTCGMVALLMWIW